MSECQFLKRCGFFKKYQTSMNLACRGFIKKYCKGNKMHDCKRKKYAEEHGEPPADDMLPTGRMIKK